MSLKIKPPQVASLNDLLEALKKAFEGVDVCVEYVEEILANYKSNIREWSKFAKFDRYRYTRNLIDTGNENYNVMLLCWGPSHQSSIHDHSDAHCFMKILSGSMEEVKFSWPKEGEEDSMKEICTTALKTNDVAYINDSLGLHRVQNASNVEEAVSLHIYLPPFESCQTFDQRTGKKNRCKMTFWSRNGVRIKQGTH